MATEVIFGTTAGSTPVDPYPAALLYGSDM
ncbi:hypothetical protein P3T37_006843 [Kitasatospora sp. MAA4]|nr:hypothetical protein [Kitasatospora sp. MAA4]